MTKLFPAILIVLVFIGGFFVVFRVLDNGAIAPTVTPGLSVSPSISVSLSPIPSKTVKPTPLPTGPTPPPGPWDKPLPDAFCELRGTIKFVLVDDGPNHNNVYDNQDAKFIYRGIDHPGRLVFWTVTPQDNIEVGPQIFAQLPIPNGESLISLSLPPNPQYKRYELSASIQYGRLVDGNVRLFTKRCVGKTIITLP